MFDIGVVVQRQFEKEIKLMSVSADFGMTGIWVLHHRRVVINVMVSNVDDHLRNHGFLWSGQGGWVLSSAYDLNPTPVDIKARILTTNIDLDEGTCSVELLQDKGESFGPGARQAHTIIREVAEVTSTWRALAAEVGARRAEITRMASAFEYNDLQVALKF